MFWSFCQGLFCLIEGFYLWLMFRITAKEKTKKSFIGIFAISLAFYFIADYAPSEYAIALRFMACFIIGFMFKCGIIKKIGICILYMLFMDISDVFVMGIINVIYPDINWNEFIRLAWFNAFGGFLSKLIAPIIILGYKRIVTTKEDVGFLKFQNIFFVILFIMLIFVEVMCKVAIGYDSTSEFRMYFSIAAILIFIAIGVIIYFFNQLVNYYIQICESKDIQHNMDITKQYYEMIEANNSEISKIIHDYKNHIITTAELLKNNECEKAAAYLSEISENLKTENIFKCDNKVVSVVINQKLAKAKENNIDLKINITASLENIIVKDIDICSLLSNILDNALEAAELTEDKGKRYVTLRIMEKGSYLYVQCVNGYKYKPVIKNNRFITTKNNKKKHGMGIKIIQDIAKKYKGEFNYNIKDDCVIISVLLNISEVEYED